MNDLNIYENLTRKNALSFLIEQGLNKDKIKNLSNDTIAYLYNTLKRGN